MTDTARPITLDDLNAYVDDALEPVRRAEVEAYLGSHPYAAEQVLAYQRQNEGMRALYGPLAEARVPSALRPSSVDARRRGRRLRAAAQAIAAVILLAVGGTGGWLARDAARPADMATAPGFTRDAAAAHVLYTAERRHAVEVGAEEEHLFRWLSNRLGTDVHAPDLASLGFSLIGGRLLPANGKPAAQFMYEDAMGERLTLYIRPDPGGEETRFEYVTEDGVGAFYWIEGRFGYALIGAQPRDIGCVPARLQPDVPVQLDGIAGIEAQVQQNLLEL